MENQVQTLELNQGQQAASDAFFQFLMGPDKEIIISGPGGTGKTFLMGYMIDTILEQYYKTCQLMGLKPKYTSVMMTATTNKAADVLGQATDRPTQTIHSFLNLKVSDDWGTGESKLEKTKKWKVHSNMVIFIDECSMIDRRLRECIEDGTSTCKIVYVGDHCQLAPVKETLSPVFTRGIPMHTLTEPMRTKVPALQALNQQLRETVQTGVFKPIKPIPGVIDLLTPREMSDQIKRDFAHQNLDTRIMAFTNRQVVNYNDYIRGLRKLGNQIEVGEVLVCNSACQLKDGLISSEEEVEVVDISATSEMIRVDDYDDTVLLEVRYATLRSKFETYENVKIPVDRAHHQALIKWYAKQKEWGTYFDLKGGYPDLRPRDACTVHKAQGSTYPSVYIDLGDISSCPQPNMAARLLYVAFTRAQHRVYMYGNLADRFGGLDLS